MRIKILIFPVMLVISIVVFIAFVWPEFGSLREAIKRLDGSKALLSGIIEKKNNIINLQNSLDQNKDKEDLALNYLPDAKKEEKIINGLNYLAANSGVTLANVSLEDVEVKVNSTEAVAEPSSSKDVLFTGAPSGDNSSPQIPMPTLQLIKSKVSIAGNYENIKTFLENVYKMEMFNDIASVSIAKAESNSQAAGGEVAPSNQNLGMLSAVLEVDFGYLPGAKISRDYSNPIFSRSNFDFTSCNKLKDLISTKIPVLETGGQGRPNPFLP